MAKSELLSRVSKLPLSSGCYIFKDKDSKVIYVGKAKELKKRVSSYFRDIHQGKTKYLVSKIKDFEFMITRSEAEALILENNLIKKYSPKYNIRLRDDKSYPYIGIDQSHDFPKLLFLRRPKKTSKLKLFGPYPIGFGVGHIMRILNKLYQLRDCSNFEFKTRQTPCLLYQIQQCSAPCVGYISKPDYQKRLEFASRFLEGKKSAQKVVDELEIQMIEAATNERFEHAAIIRDGLFDLKKFLGSDHQQQVEKLGQSQSIDLISFFIGDIEVDLSFYMVRNGLLIGQKNFHFLREDFLQDTNSQIVSLIIDHYQQDNQMLPNKLVIDLPKEHTDLIIESLSLSTEHSKISSVSPDNPNYKSILMTVKEHAEQSQLTRVQSMSGELRALSQLTSILHLKERVRTLECYDIAIWQGKSPTASLIYFEEGKPVKARYRYYHLNERPEGNNDFAMMEEVFQRRIKRENLPDIFVVDGGIGQVNSVLKVLKEYQIDVPVVGIAKSRILSEVKKFKKDIDRSEERLIIPGRKDSISLNKTPELFRLLTTMRDEAHRFSRKLHHHAEKKRIFSSWVDELKGVNDTERKQILERYPKRESFENISRDELEVLGFTKAKITRLLSHIKKPHLK